MWREWPAKIWRMVIMCRDIFILMPTGLFDILLQSCSLPHRFCCHCVLYMQFGVWWCADASRFILNLTLQTDDAFLMIKSDACSSISNFTPKRIVYASVWCAITMLKGQVACFPYNSHRTLEAVEKQTKKKEKQKKIDREQTHRSACQSYSVSHFSRKLWKYTPSSPSINAQYSEKLCEKSSQTFANELRIKI